MFFFYSFPILRAALVRIWQLFSERQRKGEEMISPHTVVRVATILVYANTNEDHGKYIFYPVFSEVPTDRSFISFSFIQFFW